MNVIRKVFQLMRGVIVMCDMQRDVERCDSHQYVEGLFHSHWGTVS